MTAPIYAAAICIITEAEKIQAFYEEMGEGRDYDSYEFNDSGQEMSECIENTARIIWWSAMAGLVLCAFEITIGVALCGWYNEKQKQDKVKPQVIVVGQQQP